MTNINDFEKRINAAETIIGELRANIDTLRVGLHYLKNQQPEPEPESLFGRWATHPKYGRGIIVSVKPDGEGEVRFAYRSSSYMDYVDTRFVLPESLDLDPATLTTAKDFNDAPEGTIAEIMVEPKGVYVKKDSVWRGAGEEYPTPVQSLAKARVIRWGNGK